MLEGYIIHILIIGSIYLVLALSLQITVGYAGLLNLAHISFFGLGAYTSSLLAINQINFLLAFTMAGFLAMAVGLLMAIVFNKFKGDYLALVTLVFSYVIYSLLLNWQNVTGGSLGIMAIPRPTVLGFPITSNIHYLILSSAFLLITFFIVYKLVKSPMGRIFEATRDDELALKTLGKNTLKIKIYAYCVSAFFAGCAGSLYAHYISFINPDSFTIMQLLPILTIIILGGLASLRGTILACFLILLLAESVRFINIPLSFAGPLRQIIYSSIIIIILIFFPKGMFGKIRLE